jgi:putative transposon-encoded protein
MMAEDVLVQDYIPVNTLLAAKNLENVFKSIFKDTYVDTSEVKTSKTSGLIYVPKRFIGKKVTILIWV